MTNEIEQIASKHLGKAGDGSVVKPYVTPDNIDAGLLVPIPRHLNRTAYGLTGDEFYGFDTWHAFEVSFLTTNGLPVNCVAKITYDCASQFIVESKSLKLYLNSYNMVTMGDNTEHAITHARQQIELDLSAALQTDVEVFLHDVAERMSSVIPVDYYEYECLDQNIDDIETVKFDEYNEDPSILKIDDNPWSHTYAVWSPSLRSNCRVTNQPDWGDVYIYLKGSSIPTNESMLKYIVSMRRENHFHEEICEAIYKRLMDVYSPTELFVTCLYTRRGGIDINPARYSHVHLGNRANGLRNTMEMSEKTPRQ